MGFPLALVALVLACSFSPASAFVPAPTRPSLSTAPRSALVRPAMVAKTPEEKELLRSSKQVTMIAKRFGVAQGKAAQAWVEMAIQGGDARTESLVGMQLALFEECSLDDKSDKCKQLTAAMEDMITAVEKRSSSSFYQNGVLKPSALSLQFGPTAVQNAASKLRAAASKFGPDQKAVADAWIKKVASGDLSVARDELLEEQVTLFGECVLSEDGSPSNCEQLIKALESFQDALEGCDITSEVPKCTVERPETDMEYRKRMSARR
mmetsp:Transcript_18113/g.36877  ORF Transcript_18113/g.36877 Transcript_18113/m.36877 type:complete len:265 (-) Transcript_18113:208-1002(-)